jgi:heme-degrading monooxygenase HmoA
MSYEIVWEFEVATDVRAAFEEAYGPQGEWAQLFENASGFLETILLSCPENARRYITIDRWASSLAVDEFQRKFAAEYAALEKRLGTIASRKTRIGAFERID